MKWFTMMFVYISMHALLICLLLSAVYFDCTVYMFFIAVSLMFMHDSVCKMLMSIGDWYHIYIVDIIIIIIFIYSPISNVHI